MALTFAAGCASRQQSLPTAENAPRAVVETTLASPAVDAPPTQPSATYYTPEDPLLVLLNTPGCFEVLRRHAPVFVNLTEFGLIPAFNMDWTLNDLLDMPESKVTAADMAAMREELARIPKIAD